MDSAVIAASRTQDFSRVGVLDGVRGWAALSVAASHIMWGVFGDVEPLLKNVFTGLFLNGFFAVMLFFILSGEALTASFWKAPGPKPIWRLVVKRYPRLALPVFGACLIVFVLTNLGLAFNREAGEALGNGWLYRFPTEPKSIYELLSFSFFYVFYRPFIEFSLVPFLWTMRTEALGSVFVVIFLCAQHLLGRWKKWALAALAAAMAVAGILTACFAIGILFGLLRRDGAFEWRSQTPRNTVLTLMALIVLLIPGSYLMLIEEESARLLIPISGLFLFLVYSDRRICDFLNNELSQGLGRISFPVFLTHYAVIISFTSWLVVVATEAGLASRPAYLSIALASLGVSLICGALFEPVERAAVKLTDLIWARLGEPAYVRWQALTVRKQRLG